MRVLVVEDEPAVRHVLDILLTRRGHHVLTAPCAHEAFALLLDFPQVPHLALIDLALPRMGGFAFGEMLRRDFPDVRLVFMTGWAEHHDIVQAQRVGELLMKPIKGDELKRLGL